MCTQDGAENEKVNRENNFISSQGVRARLFRFRQDAGNGQNRTGRLFLIAAQITHIPFLQLLTGPGSLAEELQTRIDRGIKHEAPNWNSISEPFPSMTGDERFENHLQGNAVKRIIRMGLLAGHKK